MTLRIREIVIRADVSEDSATDNHTVEELVEGGNVASESGTMTRKFYEEDFTKDNER